MRFMRRFGNPEPDTLLSRVDVVQPNRLLLLFGLVICYYTIETGRYFIRDIRFRRLIYPLYQSSVKK